VLGYPLDREAAGTAADGSRASVLEAFDARVQMLDGTPPRAPCVCKDPDDQVFIDLAVAQRALLISKDQQVLTMRKRLAAQGVVVQDGARRDLSLRRRAKKAYFATASFGPMTGAALRLLIGNTEGVAVAPACLDNTAGVHRA
jgi:hypothetical protein